MTFHPERAGRRVQPAIIARRRAAATLAITAAACVVSRGGPKDTCQGSFESYFGALKGHDWSGVWELLTPELKKKVGSPERLASAMEEVWVGAKGFSYSLDTVSQTNVGVCIANGTMSYKIKLQGHDTVDYNDEYFSWTFRQNPVDGKGYIELPGSEKISGF